MTSSTKDGTGKEERNLICDIFTPGNVTRSPVSFRKRVLWKSGGDKKLEPNRVSFQGRKSNCRCQQKWTNQNRESGTSLKIGSAKGPNKIRKNQSRPINMSCLYGHGQGRTMTVLGGGTRSLFTTTSHGYTTSNSILMVIIAEHSPFALNAY
ncbi:hypothetical protein CDAR_543271 [Caerostris darwini]|uniref:Uncharacterized protein n=1 Tax=Caerostris darwini TaxID=1538125 RepID=A0AAV4X1U8_9ARAC|nr:hypothetical protein CDAR_543271 [Caerostris darwini]